MFPGTTLSSAPAGSGLVVAEGEAPLEAAGGERSVAGKDDSGDSGLVARIQCSHRNNLTSISGRELKPHFKPPQAEANQDHN